MITRIVRLTLLPERVEDFLTRFHATYPAIRSFQGCSHLRLFRDATLSNVYITYSHWESETHLDNYRNSDLFKTTWSEVKPMFAAAPVAWSMQEIVGNYDPR
ncbi:MAG: antibiotic biosynthesis monooxygenase family protein [Bacteroidia bacterium]